MGCVKKRFFMILATAIAVCDCLKVLLTRAVAASDLAQGALRYSTQCR